MKLSALGFTALGAPFHWGACHGALPAWGDPNPQLSLHPLVWVIAVRDDMVYSNIKTDFKCINEFIEKVRRLMRT
jgi:hypothetical protein